jgi:hypothetical protein
MTPNDSRKPEPFDADREAARKQKEADEKARREEDKLHPNPPYTTKHGFTAPKFGSAGSGGAENEPGPEKD